MSEPLRLGIVGLSPGNGHPYSWSAIFNGYDVAKMATCPFPSIPQYLAAQQFPDDQLDCATVTHVWTEDRNQSADIAAASMIEHVVDNLNDLVGVVDGVLLARDDAERHVEMAVPFLEAGMAVYVDKPFALSRKEAVTLITAAKRPGQLFTGSALQYARELELSTADREEIGPIRKIIATTPKSWRTYASHIIEPVLKMMADRGQPKITHASVKAEDGLVELIWPEGETAVLIATGNASAPIRFHIFGERGYRDLLFTDSFNCFRSALELFCKGAQTGESQMDTDFILGATDIIEAGINASSTKLAKS